MTPDSTTRAFSLAGLVPELAPPFARTAPVRIPELQHVALTRRVLRVIDHPDFQRLRRVLQLGPTYLVYPGATHTRFEHSIGVYDNVRRYLLSLLQDPLFVASLTEQDILTALAAGLLHDIGHYPFAHSLEALHHKGLESPRHEDVGGLVLQGRGSGTPIALLLEREWGVRPERVVGLIHRGPDGHTAPMDRILSSILHGAIDADKMDYLERDSVHLGVPYGRNYDRDRLLSTLAVHPERHTLSVTDKGRIAAEIFLFCRYTMFSEVYWHHAVRAASAMVERALEDFRLSREMAESELVDLLLGHSDESLLRRIYELSAEGSCARRITADFAHGARRLYKRALTLSQAHLEPDVQRACRKVLRMTRPETRALEVAIALDLGRVLGRALPADAVIVDTPPPGKGSVEDLEILFEDRKSSCPLGRLSRLVEGLGADFLRAVKKTRVFVSPEAALELRERLGKEGLRARLLEAVMAAPEPRQQGELFG